MSESVKVAVRCRPMNARELQQGCRVRSQRRRPWTTNMHEMIDASEFVSHTYANQLAACSVCTSVSISYFVYLWKVCGKLVIVLSSALQPSDHVKTHEQHALTLQFCVGWFFMACCFMNLCFRRKSIKWTKLVQLGIILNERNRFAFFGSLDW